MTIYLVLIEIARIELGGREGKRVGSSNKTIMLFKSKTLSTLIL